MVRFSKEEENHIADFYLENADIIKGTSRMESQNNKRNKLYAQLVKELNRKNPDEPKTIDQVKNKIGYLQRRARANNAEEKREQRKTGGGKKKTRGLSQIDQKFVEAYGDTPSYAGVSGGLESGGDNPHRERSIEDEGDTDCSNGDEPYASDHEANLTFELEEGTGDDDTGINSTVRNLSPSVFLSQVGALVRKDDVKLRSAKLPKKRQTLTDKRNQLLMSTMENRALQERVLQAQLAAAESTVATNARLQSTLDKVDTLMDTIAAYYQRNPPMVLVANVAAGDADLIIEPQEVAQ